ncbi:hypothetical protein LIER_32968 [Lithospermum erythrorhizon]|uniref:Uncharacterized protein n=1 Tax=Lithospermum erythrorhizon TaxID=34254 RepID=A0AAV3RXV2_LITER
MHRVTGPCPGPQASHEVTRLWLQQSLELGEGLSQERLKVDVLEQELQGLRLQASEDSRYPWEVALLIQSLRKAMVERDAARAARKEKEGLRRAYLQDNPLRCRRIGAAVLSNFVLNFQDRIPTLPALVEDYRQIHGSSLPIPSSLTGLDPTLTRRSLALGFSVQ